jgi:uncharacterized membrane protein
VVPVTEDAFVNRLEREVATWRGEQLITDEQAQAILGRYGVVEAERKRRKIAWVLGFLGAILVGIGTIVFFAANWQEIPQWTKLLLIVLAVVAAYWSGFRLRYETETYRGTGNALIFLGTLLYGAAIFLVAQGLHINAHAPLLVLLWGFGVLPMAYLLQSRAMTVLAILDVGVALGWEAVLWSVAWGPAPFLAVFVVYGVLLYALGQIHGAFDRTATHRAAYSLLGLVAIFGALLPLTFPDLGSGADLGWEPGGLLRFWVFSALAAAAVVGAMCVPRRSATTFPELASALALLILAVTMASTDAALTDAIAIALNLVVLALAVGTAAVGYYNRETGWVNLGVFSFGTLVVVRYVDWCWGLLPRSLFFIGAGAVLVVGGMLLERTRRKVTKQLREAVNES